MVNLTVDLYESSLQEGHLKTVTMLSKMYIEELLPHGGNIYMDWRCMHAYVHAWEEHRFTSGIISLELFTVSFEIGCLFRTWDLLRGQGCLTAQFLGSAWPSFPRRGIMIPHHSDFRQESWDHTSSFHWKYFANLAT